LPEPSGEALQSCARTFFEDQIHEILAASDEPLRVPALARALKERGFDLPQGVIRAVLQESERFTSDGRRWEIQARVDAGEAALEGAIRAILRGPGKPMAEEDLARQVALAKQQGPKETAQVVHNFVASRPAYFRTPDGKVGLIEWLLQVESDDVEDVLLDNFFEDSAEADAILENFDGLARDSDEALMGDVLDKVGAPMSVKALQFACWRRDPEAFDPIAHFLALLDSPKFVVLSDHRVVPESWVEPMRGAIAEMAAALEEELEEEEAEVAPEEVEVSEDEVREAIALIERRRCSIPTPVLVEEALEVYPDEPSFPVVVQKLDEALRANDRVVESAPSRWTLPELIPDHYSSVPEQLVPTIVAAYTVSGEDIDVILEDQGLDGELAQIVHDPQWEDVGEEDEVDVDPEVVETPDEICYVLLNHHYRAGTMKIRRIDGEFYGGRSGLRECILRYEQGDDLVAWANLDLGLVFGLGEFYERYCYPSGSVLRLRRRETPGEYDLVWDGETHELTYLDESRMADLERLRTEAAQSNLSVFDIICSIMPSHQTGVKLLTLWAEVNVVRRTTKRLVASTLSGYQCFHQRQRRSDLWHFDPRKVEQGYSKKKKKWIRKTR